MQISGYDQEKRAFYFLTASVTEPILLFFRSNIKTGRIVTHYRIRNDITEDLTYGRENNPD